MASLVIVVSGCASKKAPPPGSASALAATTGGTTGTAGGTTTGESTASAQASSLDLIDAARTAGALSEEQAMTYRVFAVFADSRLPAAYQGDDRDLRGSHLFDELVPAFDGYSAETQALLAPFLRRPNDSQGGFHGGPSVGRSPGREASLRCTSIKPDWAFEANPSGHVKVWYDKTKTGDNLTALAAKNELENVIWPKLFGAPGVQLQAPPSDETVWACDGGDDRLDVYIVDMRTWGETATDHGETLGSSCSGAASYILINRNESGDNLKGALAHELMHSVQYGYPSSACHSAYGWMNDASANWAIDYVYGKSVQVEQNYADCYTKSPHKGLDDRAKGFCTRQSQWPRDYGAYLLFQYMTKAFGANTVKDSLEAMHSHASGVAATNQGLPSGFHDDWLEFSKTLLNRDPVDGKAASFLQWDTLGDKADLKVDMNGNVGSGVELRTDLEGEIDNLSTQFYRFTFSDLTTRSLLFKNGYIDQRKAGKALRIFAFWKDVAGTWQEEDWSEYKYVGLCRDMKMQRAVELVLVVSNGEWNASGGGKLVASQPSYLKRNNLGCWKYEGTATVLDHHSSWSGLGRQTSSQLLFQVDAQAKSLVAKHPQIADSLRVGSSLVLPLVGTSYVFTESYTDGCTYSAGPVQFPITPFPPHGFILLNTFPEIEIAEPTMQQFISANVRGAYSAAGANDVQPVPISITGPACVSGTTYTGALLVTNKAENGVILSPPTALANGDLLDSFQVTADSRVNWALHPQSEP